jgi:hypothetical protein
MVFVLDIQVKVRSNLEEPGLALLIPVMTTMGGE